MAWFVSVVGNTTVAVAYAVIASFIGWGLSRTNEWKRNRLAGRMKQRLRMWVLLPAGHPLPGMAPAQ